jgi:hypothetical protein
MPLPDNQLLVCEIVLRGNIAAGGSSPVKTNFIFHYRRLATANPSNLGNLYFQFNAGPMAAIVAALNARWTSSSVGLRWVNDATFQFFDVIVATPGAIAGDSLASDQAAYLLFRTGLRGRSNRGSKHLGPMSETDVTTPNDDIWNAGCLTRLAAINTALMAPLATAEGNNYVLTTLSRKNSILNANPTTVVTADVVAALVNKRTGSMVRRKTKSIY